MWPPHAPTWSSWPSCAPTGIGVRHGPTPYALKGHGHEHGDHDPSRRSTGTPGQCSATSARPVHPRAGNRSRALDPHDPALRRRRPVATASSRCLHRGIRSRRRRGTSLRRSACGRTDGDAQPHERCGTPRPDRLASPRASDSPPRAPSGPRRCVLAPESGPLRRRPHRTAGDSHDHRRALSPRCGDSSRMGAHDTPRRRMPEDRAVRHRCAGVACSRGAT